MYRYEMGIGFWTNGLEFFRPRDSGFGLAIRTGACDEDGLVALNFRTRADTGLRHKREDVLCPW